ncbi:MAG: signal recognition particle-docking protein FtsY [Prochlorococcaceae cyanobacterium MAG_34]|jgi:fused signal recognition particle receptor|nr:MAG: cell division protein FtsY [cyanobacterium BACL30 MAG-120619-bin27]MDP4707213.1 signal recognition particle-docking protein FtsY [Cyanobium sp. MAG_237]MDP4738048.1 signal recognition particle-docking protein FtsY [Cyanobium sp. MAG_216]MDP4882452.1 signal recognition particle-docking protein FtsY [Cyanobium sp. MAG_137]MDP4946696.1 signal recognition particle-docking protein FtsY [Cyanobium sp. MAG_102]MDP5118909.1 signal recognition particle-docking protein FtsY [Prochlorococcaceae c
MVYDWFNRTGPSPAEPSATPPPASEQVSGQAPDQAPEQPVESSSDPNAEALEWARQAYARLKAQQEEQKRLQLEAESAPEPPLPDSVQPVQINTQQPEQGLEPDPQQVAQTATPVAAPLSLLEQAAAQRAERQQAITALDAPELAEPSLGDFDTTFTWSAEVLAAQGKRVDQVSLEEIDWLARLRQGLEKTRQGLVTQLLDNLGDDPLTPEVVDGLETTLLRADVGVEATDRALGALRQRLNQEVVDPAEGLRFLKEQLRAILDQPIEASGQPLLAPRREQLNVWLLVGVNGVGKTTTLGKLANLAVRSGYSCLIAAADTFRAAAVQQVQVWGERSQVPVISNPSANADPAAVVYDAIGAAQAKGTELVLVDTAGRLQTKHNLMEELSKVRRIVDKLAPEAVVESLLVLDASQGQNGLRQAMAFAKAAGLTGVVLTKLDGSARGGVALAVASEARLPIRFIGAGEGIRDLRPFNSFEFVEALLAR